MPQNTPFKPGQRWISDSEPELGLGTLLESHDRHLTLEFPAVGVQRVYARQNAPLTRARFASGDRVETRAGLSLVVERVEEREGRLLYLGVGDDGNSLQLPEQELADTLRIVQPRQRLLAGQFDPPHWFDLRERTLEALNRWQQSPVLGLAGPRIDLIPHQLYIAHEVANRPAPRVLLADEVGLGKTIEACLILHHQLLTGRASRALILVPDPLVHQWLVELLRRFNLRFRIFDEETCQAIEASETVENPFHSEQLVLCSLALFRHNPERLSQALEGEWDLLTVDEAHHLTWSEEDPSAEYLLVEALALRTPGVLLLTATPEQLGQVGHFARLRLLDPDRYYSLEAFLQEEGLYQPVAEAVEHLLRREPLPEAAARRLLERLDEAESTPLLNAVSDAALPDEQRQAAREQLIHLLLDRHGTGRVMFRNTRARISGFPGRGLHSHPLSTPSAYEFEREREAPAAIPPAWYLAPERIYAALGHRQWWRIDPRVEWLIGFLRQQPDTKLLLICAHAETAIELQEAVRVQAGIRSGLFHEGMTLLERDRAAAWFADPEGARLLICSEIGSEGRNFQFAHQLVMFDLPPDPDLLEQRIGRLDRIGQRHRVEIHVPYLEPGPQTVMLQWYRDGLDAFRHQVQGAAGICEALADRLWTLLMQPDGSDQPSLDALIAATRQLRQETEERLQQGRDHLLELGGCREPEAGELVAAVRERDHSPELKAYLDTLFDSYNVDTEPLGKGLILKPGDQVIAGSLPGLPGDGLTVTFDRHDALAHEDRQFLSWEHPLVTGAMEQVTKQQTGNSAVIAVRHPALKAGQLLLESLFVLESLAPRRLHVGRFLPPTLIRTLLNVRGRRLDGEIDCQSLTAAAQPLEPQQIQPVLQTYREAIQGLMTSAESAAQSEVHTLIGRATKRMMSEYTEEIQRMSALRRHNPGVREDEIQLLQTQGAELHRHLQRARLRLDAVRLVVTL
ncbi:MAG: RNA polymerase-associated protein RapA [Candidatus Thiodiazotropha sp.]